LLNAATYELDREMTLAVTCSRLLLRVSLSVASSPDSHPLLLAYFILLFWLVFLCFFTVSLLLTRRALFLIAPWQRGKQVEQHGRNLHRNKC
jgi:hypothetical protein